MRFPPQRVLSSWRRPERAHFFVQELHGILSPFLIFSGMGQAKFVSVIFLFLELRRSGKFGQFRTSPLHKVL